MSKPLPDPGALRAAADQLDRAIRQLAELVAGLAARTTASESHWRGPVSDRYRVQVNDEGKRLKAEVGRLTALSADLRRQAAHAEAERHFFGMLENRVRDAIHELQQLGKEVPMLALPPPAHPDWAGVAQKLGIGSGGR